MYSNIASDVLSDADVGTVLTECMGVVSTASLSITCVATSHSLHATLTRWKHTTGMACSKNITQLLNVMGNELDVALLEWARAQEDGIGTSTYGHARHGSEM